ncbi:MAG TPA: hypothetical protein VNX88_15050 [Terriglobales bacterium]|nr:hypothetical protein [Terriglobales bacterium]
MQKDGPDFGPSLGQKQPDDYAVFASDVTGSEIEVTFDLLGAEVTIFISCQSYANSFPQSRHTTYVPVWAAAPERREPLAVLGKL